MMFIASFSLQGQTYVSGIIDTDVEWTAAGSPYIILDSLIVEESGFLNISEGTVVREEFRETFEKEYRIDLSALAPGIYSVAVNTGKIKGVRRLIVVR